MRQRESAVEGCKVGEGVHHARLMSVLQELVSDKGPTEASRVLDVNYKTVARSMKAGRLSEKMRGALERTLQNGEGCAAAGQRERNVRVWKRLDELEGQFRRGLTELGTALDEHRQEITRLWEKYARQQEDHARHRQRVERQLSALVLGNSVTVPETPGIEENGTDESEVACTGSGPPWWRPGKAAEDRVMDLVDEWWRARTWLIAAEERVNIAMGWDTFTDLAVRDERTEAPAEPRSSRRIVRSKRNLDHSRPVEHDMAEAGHGQV